MHFLQGFFLKRSDKLAKEVHPHTKTRFDVTYPITFLNVEKILPKHLSPSFYFRDSTVLSDLPLSRHKLFKSKIPKGEVEIIELSSNFYSEGLSSHLLENAIQHTNSRVEKFLLIQLNFLFFCRFTNFLLSLFSNMFVFKGLFEVFSPLPFHRRSKVKAFQKFSLHKNIFC